jgi:hypothetical protein
VRWFLCSALAECSFLAFLSILGIAASIAMTIHADLFPLVSAVANDDNSLFWCDVSEILTGVLSAMLQATPKLILIINY